MSDRANLPYSFADKMLRLIGRVHQAPQHDGEWRRRLIDGMARLLRADAAVLLEMNSERRRGALKIAEHTGSGRLDGLTSADEFELLSQRAVKLLTPEDPVATCTRQKLVADGAWTRSPLRQQVLGPDDLSRCVVSVARPMTEWYILVALFRVDGRPTFSAADVDRLDLLHRRIDWIYRERRNSIETATAKLSPRLRHVLNDLLNGDSAKQIAYRMSLSQHTVRGYIKQIYRRFHVSSRGELLSRCLNNSPDRRDRN